MKTDLKSIIVKVGNREFKIRELLASEVENFDNLEQKDRTKQQLMLSANLTTEDYDNLLFKEKLAIIKAFNNLNIPEDFL
jgi:hypothetical protein